MNQKIESKSDYCVKCSRRIDMERTPEDERIIITNKGTQCSLGYTQNPRTESKTRETLRNGGVNSICGKNPWKFRR